MKFIEIYHLNVSMAGGDIRAGVPLFRRLSRILHGSHGQGPPHGPPSNPQPYTVHPQPHTPTPQTPNDKPDKPSRSSPATENWFIPQIGV
jgi:hypothetical protein